MKGKPALACAEIFRWADHACRFCGSRVGESAMPDGSKLYSCGNCTLETKGKPDGICGCGVHLGPKGKGEMRAGPRFRCVLNPARSPTNPSAVVIEYA